MGSGDSWAERFDKEKKETQANETRLEELRVKSIFACDRAIEALQEYKMEALFGGKNNGNTE